MPHKKIDSICDEADQQQHHLSWADYCKLREQELGSFARRTPVVNLVRTLSVCGRLAKGVLLCNQPVLFSDQSILRGLRQRLAAMRLRWERLAQSPRKQDFLSQLQAPGSQLGYLKQSSKRALLRWFSKGEQVYDENWFLKYKAMRYHYEHLLTQEPGVKGLLEHLLLPVPRSNN